MKKKEAIKLLQKYKIEYYFARDVLEPIKQQALQRGARMQVMYKLLNRRQIDSLQLNEIDSWFDTDGVPVL